MITDHWIPDDPFRTTEFDVSNYNWVRWWIDGKLGNVGDERPPGITTDYNDPWLLDEMMGLGYAYRGSNPNPYFVPQIRDALRDLAMRMEMPAWYADRAALDYAESTLFGNHQYYSEATSPKIVVDEIVTRLNALTTKYRAPTLTHEQRAAATFEAQNLQDNIKSHRESAEDAADWAHGMQIIAVFAAPVAALVGVAATAITEALSTTVAASAEAAAAATQLAIETAGVPASAAPEISVFGEGVMAASQGWEGFGNFAYKFLENTYQAYKSGAFTTAPVKPRNTSAPTPLYIPVASVDDVAPQPEIRQAVSFIGLILLMQELTK